jgi:carbamoylphosphate synthase small subunit
VPISLTLVPGEAAFTTSTSVGIGVGVVITDTSTGEVIFTSVNHGFDVNAVQTTTCTHTFEDGQTFAVTAFFTPAQTH